MFGLGKQHKPAVAPAAAPGTEQEQQPKSPARARPSAQAAGSGQSEQTARTELPEQAAKPEPPQQTAHPAQAVQPGSPPGLLGRLRQGLSRTRGRLGDGIGALVMGAGTGAGGAPGPGGAFGSKAIAADLLDEIETRLLTADVGLAATEQIIAGLKGRLARRQLADPAAFMQALKAELEAILTPCAQPLTIPADRRPYVILVVGVNGVGKTTTIGKLAAHFKQQGLSVMLAAGDTFRAAAVEQLQVWGERNQLPVVAQGSGADSASVIYDACQAARARQVDVLIADTAGRLHTKDNLLRELEKIVRVLGKQNPRLPDEILLVLDATTGQNAISQTETFRDAVAVTGLALTKLDGTAKGGVLFALAQRFGLPIRFIGLGEQLDDLRPFTAAEFVAALFAES